jgi:pimeloyl-ACP methyl ester carboxylesterase
MTKLFLILFVFLAVLGKTQRDTLISFKHKSLNVNVQIKYPHQKNKGTILLLHGYNLPFMQWCDKTDFCTLALKNGYTLIIPDFAKTTYQEKFYAQTNPAYRIYPTRKWIRDTVIASIQKQFNLLQINQNNFTLGLSTGARGAALLALDMPKIFKGAACLSGDYDQTKLPYEKIYHNYYGDFKTYKTIWQSEDNLHALIQKWETPLYLAHGELDKICPVSQTKNFYALLKKTKPLVKCTYVIAKEHKHDYAFWGSQTTGVLRFFNDLIEK